MKESHIVMLLTFLLLIPATIYFGLRFSGRAYYVTSTLVMIETLVPFLLAFENRKPQARELVVIAVLSALAVAARAVHEKKFCRVWYRNVKICPSSSCQEGEYGQ